MTKVIGAIAVAVFVGWCVCGVLEAKATLEGLQAARIAQAVQR